VFLFLQLEPFGLGPTATNIGFLFLQLEPFELAPTVLAPTAINIGFLFLQLEPFELAPTATRIRFLFLQLEPFELAPTATHIGFLFLQLEPFELEPCCHQNRIYILTVRTISWGGVEPSPLLLRPLNGLLYQPRMMDGDECGAVGRMIGRGNRSTRRKPAPMPHFPPQIPHDPTRARTRAAPVGIRRLTA
jgi:hypothetical protein